MARNLIWEPGWMVKLIIEIWDVRGMPSYWRKIMCLVSVWYAWAHPKGDVQLVAGCSGQKGVLGMIWEGDTHLKADILSIEPKVIGKNVNAHRDYEGWEDKQILGKPLKNTNI